MEEKIYTVPIAKAKKSPRSRRAKVAMREIKDFLKKHTKSENIKIDKSVNELLWERGIKNSPAKIRLKVVKIDENIWAYTPEAEVRAEKEKKKEEETVEEEKQSHAEKD